MRVEKANAERYLLAVENLFAPAVGERDEEIEHLALERARVRHTHHRQGQQVFINPRRCERISRADFPAILQHRFRRFRTIDAIAGGVSLDVGENVVADPSERQISDHFLFLVEAVEGIGVARRDDRVLVGEHHALGAAGRSRGVKDDAEIAALAGSDAGFPLRQTIGVIRELLAADRLHVRESNQPAVVVVLEAARLVVNDLLKLWHAIGYGDDFIDLLLILDHPERHFGMRQNVGHFVGDRVGIDRHRHGAERLAGAHRPIEPRAIAADNRELVPAFEPKLGKADREGADLLKHLRPRPRLPDAEILVAHGGTRPQRRSIMDKELGQRI